MAWLKRKSSFKSKRMHLQVVQNYRRSWNAFGLNRRRRKRNERRDASNDKEESNSKLITESKYQNKMVQSLHPEKR
jgi:hypothetical protein